ASMRRSSVGAEGLKLPMILHRHCTPMSAVSGRGAHEPLDTSNADVHFAFRNSFIGGLFDGDSSRRGALEAIERRFLLESRLRFPRRERPAVEVALVFVVAQAAQEIVLVRALDALGHDAQPQPVGE